MYIFTRGTHNSKKKKPIQKKKRIQIGFTYSYLSALVYSQFWPMTCSGEAEIRSQLLKKSRKRTQHVETKICFVRVTRQKPSKRFLDGTCCSLFSKRDKRTFKTPSDILPVTSTSARVLRVYSSRRKSPTNRIILVRVYRSIGTRVTHEQRRVRYWRTVKFGSVASASRSSTRLQEFAALRPPLEARLSPVAVQVEVGQDRVHGSWKNEFSIDPSTVNYRNTVLIFRAIVRLVVGALSE